MRMTAMFVTIATAVALSPGTAAAEVRVNPVATPPVWAEIRTAQPIRDSVRTIDYGPPARQRVPGASLQTSASRPRRSMTRKVLGGAIGATGGFFAGAYLGAFIEGDRCNCDDPGLKGALIGAPVGAVTGGILGAMFF